MPDIPSVEFLFDCKSFMSLEIESPDRAEARLPLDIEQEIFVLAFHDCDNLAEQTSLFRVAKRVFEWLTPLFYKVVVIHHGGDARYPPLASLTRYGHQVRHLFAMNTGGNLPIPISDLLSACPNVMDLAFWHGFPFSSEVFNLPIERIAINDINFAFLKTELGERTDELTKWSSNITHIVLGDTFSESDSEHLTHFPDLKYLMILDFNDSGGVDAALRLFPQLKVVVRLLGRVSDRSQTQVVGGPYRDVRIVSMDGLFKEDWVRGAKGLEDLWDIAEREVERRRREG